MTKKDLFRLILKIFGLYLIINLIFDYLPVNISFAAENPELFSVSLLAVILIIDVALIILLIFKPDFIIRILKLDKGFDEERIDFSNFNISNLLKLAIVIIGGILLIKSIPSFLTNLFFAFRSSLGNGSGNSSLFHFGSINDYMRLGTSFLNIIIGWLLLANYDALSCILKKKES